MTVNVNRPMGCVRWIRTIRVGSRDGRCFGKRDHQPDACSALNDKNIGLLDALLRGLVRHEPVGVA
jgi:hypothetical protein